MSVVYVYMLHLPSIYFVLTHPSKFISLDRFIRLLRSTQFYDTNSSRCRRYSGIAEKVWVNSARTVTRPIMHNGTRHVKGAKEAIRRTASPKSSKQLIMESRIKTKQKKFMPHFDMYLVVIVRQTIKLIFLPYTARG